MTKPKLIVTRKWPASVEARLRETFDVTLNETDVPFDAAAFVSAFQNYDAVLPTVSDMIPADAYTAPNVRTKLLANFGVGYNHIDITAAHAAGMTVTNTPGVLTDCTADIAMGLLLSSARRIGEGEREVRSDNWTGWRPTHMIGAKVTGATLGIIGFGRIGQAMAHRAHHGFGMKVVFQNRSKVADDIAAQTNATQLDTVAEVMAASDFVSLHCPGGQAEPIVNAAALAAMKPSGHLINTARGDVVDETALTAALKEGRIAGAGLDVFEKEPSIPADLKALDNVVLAPHLGSATLETREAMGNMATDNAIAFFDGDTPPNLVQG
ncbi:D-glycerate dehydrogenase [Amylibacter sp. SFDW26]|uniref:2-hydroxyacid dehydrogenase n=1 Tax=Amylibacter sp. SFDW26 TaxID=2652722 RepID=UPI001D01CBB7|nr:D-glycerate dehydrogenase [Amylibacter sp. SFDW26]